MQNADILSILKGDKNNINLSDNYNHLDHPKPMNEINTKNRKGRPNKDMKYIEEQKQILNKMYNILGIDNKNKIIYFCDLDDESKKKKILDLLPEVKKFFNCGSWAVFKKNASNPHLSLIRSILKYMKIKTKRVHILEENIEKIQMSGIKIVD